MCDFLPKRRTFAGHILPWELLKCIGKQEIIRNLAETIVLNLKIQQQLMALLPDKYVDWMQQSRLLFNLGMRHH